MVVVAETRENETGQPVLYVELAEAPVVAICRCAERGCTVMEARAAPDRGYWEALVTLSIARTVVVGRLWNAERWWWLGVWLLNWLDHSALRHKPG